MLLCNPEPTRGNPTAARTPPRVSATCPVCSVRDLPGLYLYLPPPPPPYVHPFPPKVTQSTQGSAEGRTCESRAAQIRRASTVIVSERRSREPNDLKSGSERG